MKRIQKATVKQPHRLQAPRSSSLSCLNLSKAGSSRQILRKVARSTELSGGDIAIEPNWQLAITSTLSVLPVWFDISVKGKARGYTPT